MISTLNPTFIFPASFIPSHKELFNFSGITTNRNELPEDKHLIVMLPVCFSADIKLTYDANGNLVTGDGYYRVYNSLNQLSKIYNGSSTSGKLLEEYTYHPTEERVLIKKVYYLNTSLKETVYYVSDEFVRVVNTSGTYNTVYVKHEGQLIAEQRNNSNKLFYHPDHLGSTTLITNQSGNVVDNVSYSPYGSIIGGKNASRYSYTGQEFDNVIGDYDYHARRYKSEWGKFTKPDVILPNTYNPQELNRYAYVKNNPYKYVDEKGDFAIPPIMLAGAIVGAVFNAGFYLATTNNFQWSGLATYAGSGAIQGGLSVLNPVGALFGSAIGEAIEKVYGGEDITSLEGIFDIAAEGTLSAASFGLGKAFLPKAGIHKIKYLISYFTTKTGVQFISNQAIENLGSTAGSAAYKYGANIKYTNSAINANQVESSNAMFSPNIVSSGSGGGCSSCVTVKSDKDVRKVAYQLGVEVYKSLTNKINKNKAKNSKK